MGKVEFSFNLVQFGQNCYGRRIMEDHVITTNQTIMYRTNLEDKLGAKDLRLVLNFGNYLVFCHN